MVDLADFAIRTPDFGREIESQVVTQSPETRPVAMRRIERRGCAIFEAHRNHQATPERSSKAQGSHGAPFKDFAALGSVRDTPREWRFRKSDLPAERLLDAMLLDEPSLVEIPPGHRRKTTVETCLVDTPPHRKIGAG